ncbi:hypothetical protein P9112_005678 [Eukaryota sp. TZLM1-RC]
MKSILLPLLFTFCLAHVYFQETFDNTDAWVQSKHQNGEFVLSPVNEEYPEDLGLKTNVDARFYAYSAKFNAVHSNKDKPLVLSYQVKNTQERSSCGGSYIKLLPADVDQENFNGDSKYIIMFGPDQCGSSKKLHFILSKDESTPANHQWKHVDSHKVRPPTDKKSHVFTLVVLPDNTYQVYVDKNLKQAGSIADDFDILPPKTIPDPLHVRPDDWDEEEYIDDPEDLIPDDYPNEFIPDPEAEKPEEWDEEEDGQWEAPLIKNPEYKPFKPKRLKNPNYNGKWQEKYISNPEFEKVSHLENSLYIVENIGAIGFDLWTVESGSVFDNVIVADNLDEVWDFVDNTYGKLHDLENEKHQKAEEQKKKEDEERRKKWEKEREEKVVEQSNDEEFDSEFDEL